MKYILMMFLMTFTSCAMLPFLVEEAEEAVVFEKDAIVHEIQLRSVQQNEILAHPKNDEKMENKN